jgi:ubiquinone/menaquinone biosynthesis C-methylase UbiE
VSSSPDDEDERSPWYELVLEYLAPMQGKRVLEIACGRGGFSNVLRSRGANVFGADFSAAALGIASQKAGRDDAGFLRSGLSQADAHHLPFADSAFDCVISCETIEHLTDPPAALGEMARVCKPGGMLYLTTPNYLNLMGLYLVYDAILKKERHYAITQPLDHRWLFARVRRIVERAGWEILKSDGTVHQAPVPGRNPVRLKFLEGNTALRRLLSPVAFHYFILARKASA